MRPDPKFSIGDYVRATLADAATMSLTGVVRSGVYEQCFTPGGEPTNEWAYTYMVEFRSNEPVVMLERFLRRARIDE